jgi:hypothetical protein
LQLTDIPTPHSDQIVGIAKASINTGSNASLCKIHKGCPVAIRVDLD